MMHDTGHTDALLTAPRTRRDPVAGLETFRARIEELVAAVEDAELLLAEPQRHDLRYEHGAVINAMDDLLIKVDRLRWEMDE